MHRGRKAGSFGDGGMIITGDEKLAERLAMLRNHGSSSKDIYSMLGFNSRLDTLQAAILRLKLHHLDRWIRQRIKNRDAVHKGLHDKDIATGIYYPPCLHVQEVFKDLGYAPGDFPVAEKVQDEVLSLSMYPELTTDMIDTIVSAIKEMV